MNEQHKEKIIEILRNEDSGSALSEPGCNALKGLLLISKYLPNSGISGACHDVIYTCSLDDLLGAGITEDDARRLRDLNWMLDGGYVLACYV